MNIIPKPNKISLLSGRTPYGADTVVAGAFPKAQATAKELLAGKKGCGASTLTFREQPELDTEGYTLVAEGGDVVVGASTEQGAYYALMTLEQLAIEGGIPSCRIEDAPEFSYRGFMLDSARHFWSIDTLKRYVNVLSRLKMNVMHLHLTDDQGWRVEIKKYPLLTQKGSIRRNTQISLKGYNRGKEAHDDQVYGEGCYYTQAELKELVAYAKERFVDIVPEINMPGHMVAAIACYPELSCTGEATEVSTRWGVMDNICCCGKEDVYRFARDVIDELCEIFPFPYFHIGGDEVPKTAWKRCPACQDAIRKLGLKDENALQGYFNGQIAAYLKTKGKIMMGWNEILDGAEHLDPDAVVQWWIGRRGNRQEKEWLRNGGKTVLSYSDYVYMDHPYHIRPLAKTYSFGLKAMGIAAGQKVLGAEIPQWTEYIPNEKKLDMLTAARLAAFSEVTWTEDDNKDYADFEQRLEALRGYLKEIGCNVCMQELYRGKIKPRFAIGAQLKWALWHRDVHYEWNRVKDLL